jgi:hypothetical protein
VEQDSVPREQSEQPAAMQGADYEYDEAHDMSETDMARLTPVPHRVETPPDVSAGEGGDYGYDEAHDFGAS